MFEWIDINKCNPPHRVTNEEHLEFLINELGNGWKGDCPVLLGYYLDNIIQLISGSHRYAAAKFLGINVPVFLYEYSYIDNIYGTDRWIEMMQQPPLLKEFI